MIGYVNIHWNYDFGLHKQCRKSTFAVLQNQNFTYLLIWLDINVTNLDNLNQIDITLNHFGELIESF
jgi:hypothetical protein